MPVTPAEIRQELVFEPETIAITNDDFIQREPVADLI